MKYQHDKRRGFPCDELTQAVVASNFFPVVGAMRLAHGSEMESRRSALKWLNCG
jgi:hypothetical protein